MAASRRISVFTLRFVRILHSRKDRPKSSVFLSTNVRSADHAQQRLAMALCLTLSGCNLIYDSNVKQCRVDQDCLERGFENSICVSDLCQPATDASFTSGEAGAIASPTSQDATVKITGLNADASSDRGAPDSSSLGAMPADAGPVADAALTGPAMDAHSAAWEDGRADMLSSDGGSCEGVDCPQCQTDKDCKALGMMESTCADGICWAPEPECNADGDCVALGPEYAGGKCLESRCWPNPRFRCERPDVEGNFTPTELSTLVRDSLSLSPLKNISAKVCAKLDLECTGPLAQATTSDDGILRFTVPANFGGYLKVEASTYMPAIYSIPAALPKDGVLQPFPLLGSGVIADALALTLGARLDPSRGHMMLISEDCMGTALAGVSFSSPQKDSRTVQFYVRDLLPSTSVTDTGEIGNGGYLNFPAGTAVVTVTENARQLRLATVSVVVKPGFVTVTYIRPEPR